MSFKNYLFILLTFITSASLAQLNTATLTIDLKEPYDSSVQLSTKYITRNLSVNCRELIAIKLKNANPLKYNYTIDSKFLDFFENQTNNLLDSSLLKGKSLNENTDGNESINTLEKEATKLFTSKSTASALFIDTIKYKYYLENVKKSIKATNNNEDSINIVNALDALALAFTDLSIQLNNYKTTISNQETIDNSDFLSNKENLNVRYLKLLENFKDISNESKNINDKSKLIRNKIDLIVDQMTKLNNELVNLNKINLSNYLLPIDVNGKNIDALQFTVKKSLVSNPNLKPEIYTYNIWLKGGVKIDVSGGLFMTSLMDKEYEKVDSGSKKLIFEKDNGKYDFGFGSLLNISARTATWIRPTLSIGALFTANQKFQILFGGGIIFGKEQRVILHGGLTMGRVITIVDRYKTDGTVAYDLGSNGDIPVNNKFKFGRFFGLTYNLTKVNKQVIGKTE